jgi:2-dehydropantoate 2-reductase
MKILVVGAGAIGGFLAARMLEAGLDVTLLVREARKRQLLETGLVVVSPVGDYTGRPALLVSGETAHPYDLVIIACKSYALEAVLKDIQPYLHEQTILLPFLNGMRHMSKIAELYPGQPLLGGVARAESTLDEQGRIMHLTPLNRFTYGNYGHISEELYQKIRTTFASVAPLIEKDDIEQDLWEKYSYISALSGLTTLFQGTVGDIRDTPGGLDWFNRAFNETTSVIRKAGGRLADDLVDRYMKTVAGMAPDSTSSMHRDMQKGLPTEYEYIQGYLVELAKKHDVKAPLLETMYQRLAVYERRRK